MKYFLEPSTSIYEITDAQVAAKAATYNNDRYLVEQEIQAEMQSQSEMTVHLHIFSLNPYRATVKLGKVSDNWWEEFL